MPNYQPGTSLVRRSFFLAPLAWALPAPAQTVIPPSLLERGAKLLADLVPAGLDGPAMIESAREVLVQSIHIGVALTAVAALSAVLMVRRVSHITFRKA